MSRSFEKEMEDVRRMDHPDTGEELLFYADIYKMLGYTPGGSTLRRAEVVGIEHFPSFPNVRHHGGARPPRWVTHYGAYCFAEKTDGLPAKRLVSYCKKRGWDTPNTLTDQDRKSVAAELTWSANHLRTLGKFLGTKVENSPFWDAHFKAVAAVEEMSSFFQSE